MLASLLPVTVTYSTLCTTFTVPLLNLSGLSEGSYLVMCI